MTAALALVEPLPPSEPLRDEVEPLVRRLHLIMMGIQADAIEATNMVSSERAKRDLEKGIKDANRLILEIKTVLGSAPKD